MLVYDVLVYRRDGIAIVHRSYGSLPEDKTDLFASLLSAVSALAKVMGEDEVRTVDFRDRLVYVRSFGEFLVAVYADAKAPRGKLEVLATRVGEVVGGRFRDLLKGEVERDKQKEVERVIDGVYAEVFAEKPEVEEVAYIPVPREGGPPVAVSREELKVLGLCNGKRDIREIASKLGISPLEVRVIVEELLRKGALKELKMAVKGGGF